MRLTAVLMLLALAASASAQTPEPVERVTFQQAIERAALRHPTLTAATAGILRAEGLLQQARAATRPFATASITTTTLNTGVEFAGSVVTPRNQIRGSLTADLPIVAAAAWARRTQAMDAKGIAELTVADTRRQVALAAADAYLTIIAQRRNVEANSRARDTARAHYDLASELERAGSGSRLNAIRAQQEASTDDVLVESARLALYRAQEALGVLIVADGPVDATDEPSFDLPADAAPVAAQGGNLTTGLLQYRTDLKLFTGQVQAAERVLGDSSKDWWPSVDAIFQPAILYPTPLFSTARGWQFLLQADIPLFDGGQRQGARIQRQAALDVSKATLTSAVTQASSEVRAAREAVASGERSLVSTRAAADQAQQVVNIVNISFRAGASTNIEVIDAERSARDADTAVAAAEDTLRRARLDLLLALGRFP
ncbi:MAG: TolC family protein [Acidobacteriota bacterium]